MIVDALCEYEYPVYMHTRPHGELRGGSWVVVDPTINEEKMSMYADPDSRGGILEPAGIIEVKFRDKDQVSVMHPLHPQLQLLKETTKEKIAVCENKLKAMYTQVVTDLTALHDKTGCINAKGVIKVAFPSMEPLL